MSPTRKVDGGAQTQAGPGARASESALTLTNGFSVAPRRGSTLCFCAPFLRRSIRN